MFHQLLKRICLICIALLFIPLNQAIATEQLPSQQNISNQVQNEPSEEESIEATIKNQRLPQQDIQRFVTAIAIIHHYYIHATKNNNLFNNAIRGMVSALDPHSIYLDSNELKDLKTTVSGKFVGIGIELTLKDGMLKVISPLDDSPAQKAGIKPNDLIIKVDNTLIRNMNINEAVKKIKGEKGSKVKLTILRKGTEKPVVVSITRDVIKLVSVKSEMLEKQYGYIRITFFQGPVASQLRNAVNSLTKQADGKLKGLVLDFRNNPGGLLDVSAKVADDFLDANKLNKYDNNIVYTKGRIAGSNMQLKAHPGDIIKGIPMVVLINGGSASASEIVAGALQDYRRAIIMGTRSFGKGSVQTVLPVGKDSAIKLTTALYYTPAGRVIQARGIIPDVTVPQLSVKDLDTKSFLIDEADFQNHLLNGLAKKTKEELDARKKKLKKQLALAKKDYQLYEALLMLQGLHSIKHHGYKKDH